jgi:hypothetical protein
MPMATSFQSKFAVELYPDTGVMGKNAIRDGTKD